MSDDTPCIGVISEDVHGAVSSYKWVIPDFNANSCIHMRDVIESPTFTTNYDNKALDWKLYLGPIHWNSRDCLSVSIFPSSKNIKNIQEIKLSILNNRNKKAFEFCSKPPPRPLFVTLNRLTHENSRLFVDNKLTILCQIIGNSNTAVVLKQEEKEDVKQIETSIKTVCSLAICDDYEKLFESGVGSDVVFMADGKEFKVHKIILIARSSVFAAMFAHEMQESIQNAVEIKGIKPKVLKELLRFIYSGKVKGITKIADDLLVAAERYSVEELKSMCETILCDKLSLDNVLYYLSLAELNNTANLKCKAILFFVSNSEIIVDKPEFKAFSKSHADLMYEIYRASMGKMGKSLK